MKGEPEDTSEGKTRQRAGQCDPELTGRPGRGFQFSHSPERNHEDTASTNSPVAGSQHMRELMHQQRTAKHEEEDRGPKQSSTCVLDISVPRKNAHGIDQKSGVELHRNATEVEKSERFPAKARHPFDARPHPSDTPMAPPVPDSLEERAELLPARGRRPGFKPPGRDYLERISAWFHLNRLFAGRRPRVVLPPNLCIFTSPNSPPATCCWHSLPNCPIPPRSGWPPDSPATR